MQKPSEALDPMMPINGIRQDSVDAIVALDDLPSVLWGLSLAHHIAVPEKIFRQKH